MQASHGLFCFLFLSNGTNRGTYKNHWKVVKKWSKHLIPTHQIQYVNNNEKYFITYIDVEENK